MASTARHTVQLIADASQFEQGIMSATTALARFTKAQKAAVGGVEGLGEGQASLHVSKQMAEESKRIATAQAKIFDNLGLRIPEQAKNAAASWSAFNAVFDETGQKLEYAVQKNRELTAAMGGVSKSARDSAAAFQEVWKQQEVLAASTERTQQKMASLNAQIRATQQQSQFNLANPFKQQVMLVQQLNALIAHRKTLEIGTIPALEAQLEIRRKIAQIRSLRNDLTASNTAMRDQMGLFQAGSKQASLYGMRLQGVGYQLQDFVVQVGSGQSALVAFAQQGSQLLSVMGGWKWAMAGMGLAIGAVVARIVMMATKTEEATTKFETQKEALRALTESYRELELAKLKAAGDTTGRAARADVFAKEDLEAAEKALPRLERAAQDADARVEFLTQKLRKLNDQASKTMFGGGNTDLVKTLIQLRSAQKEAATATQLFTEHMEKLRRSQTGVVESTSELSKATEEAVDKALTEWFSLQEHVQKAYEEMMKYRADWRRDMEKPLEVFKQEGDTWDKQVAENKRLAESYRDLIDPLGALQRQLDRVQELVYSEDLTQAQADAVSEALREQMNKVTSFQKLMSQTWRDVSDRAGQAFADMVLTGENAFKKLADIVARAALEIAAQMAVINPLMNMVFGSAGLGGSLLPAWFGKGKVPGTATGGSMWAGETRMVGEDGPELITAAQGGRIYSSSKTSDMMGGSRQPSAVVQIYQTFTGGVTAADLGRMAKEMPKMVKQAVQDASSRNQLRFA